MKENLQKYPVGGVILFSRNIWNRKQTKKLIRKLQKNAAMPLFISVDEEGGDVARIGNNKKMKTDTFPTMEEIGKTQDADYVYYMASTIASQIGELGFNVDFAPVADVWTNAENQVIGDRSFGSDPELVSDMASAEIRGFHEAGIRTAVKHFPGHGDTAEDSHSGYAYSYRTAEEQRTLEWKPFQAGIGAQTEFVMVGHICCPNITDSDIPASLSEELVTGILREELGFDGIVVTDAMNMGAITEHYAAGEASALAIEAGADMILMPEDLSEAYTAVLQAVKEGKISEERIDASLERINREKTK